MNTRRFVMYCFILAALSGVRANSSASKPVDMSLYTLRVHIFDSSSAIVGGNNSFQHNGGSGRANLIDGKDIHGIDFSYECDTKYMASVGVQAYAARWKKPEKSIEVVGTKVGETDKTNLCEFKVSMHDYLYYMDKGTLTTLSQSEYRAKLAPPPLPPAPPVDSDPSHYPLRLSILEINWTAINNVRSATGRGNLLTPAGPVSVDITTNCPTHFPATTANRAYSGRWTQEGTEMALLLHSTTDRSVALGCTLKTAVHTDVYIFDVSGTIKAVSAEEYRRLKAATATPAAPPPP